MKSRSFLRLLRNKRHGQSCRKEWAEKKIRATEVKIGTCTVEVVLQREDDGSDTNVDEDPVGGSLGRASWQVGYV